MLYFWYLMVCWVDRYRSVPPINQDGAGPMHVGDAHDNVARVVGIHLHCSFCRKSSISPKSSPALQSLSAMSAWTLHGHRPGGQHSFYLRTRTNIGKLRPMTFCCEAAHAYDQPCSRWPDWLRLRRVERQTGGSRGRAKRAPRQLSKTNRHRRLSKQPRRSQLDASAQSISWETWPLRRKPDAEAKPDN